MATKIKIVEPYNDIIVCKGKLVFIPANNLSRDYVRLADGKEVTPFIISETEEIEMGDLIYSHDKKDLLGNNKKYTVCSKPESLRGNKSYSKVLAIPENFSSEQLQMIFNGKLKDGDEVFVECEEDKLFPRNPEYPKQIKLNKDNHIKLFPSEHICKYCGAITSQPDEECWNAPNKLDSILENEEDKWDKISEEWGKKHGHHNTDEDFGRIFKFLKENFNSPTRKNK